MGSFCSSKPQVSTYKPAAEVSTGYKDLLSRASPLLDRQYPEYAGQLVAGLSPYTTAAGQGIAGLGGGTQGAYNMAQGLALAGAAPIQPMQFSGEAVGQYLSPYLQNVMGATAANIAQTNAQQQSQLTGNAIQRGAYGGDRAGIAAAELARQQNLANNATLANIANQGYQSALGMFNQQQLANMQAQLQSGQLAQGAGNLLGNLATGGQQASLAQLGAQLQYGGLEQQQRQAELSTAYQQFLNKQQYPYQQLGWYGGLLGGAAQGMGGTTTTQAAQPSMFNQLLGAGIGLAAMGGTGGIGALGSSLLGGYKVLTGQANGGRVKDDGYADGGVVGAGPIAGMKAQDFFPQQQVQGRFQPVQHQQEVDPNAGLGKMVNDIRTLLKPGQSGVAGADEKSKSNTEGMDPNPPIPMAPQRQYAIGGGVAPFNFDYGLTTKDDLSQLAESQAGSGYGSMSPQMEAEASSGLIGAAHGGRIGYQEGGVAPAVFDPNPFVEKFEPYYVARESRGIPTAKNPNSTASGLYQITDPTFEGIRKANPDITDKNDRRAYQHLATEVATALHGQGVEPTPQNMYMGMFLGSKAGTTFLKNMQDPRNADAPAYTMVDPKVYQANPRNFFDKSGRPYTMQETLNVLNREPGTPFPSAAYSQAQTEKAQTPPFREKEWPGVESKSEKAGLLGMLGISTTPEERLALMQAGFKLAGTPGRPGVGLAAAAETYAKTLMDARNQTRERARTQAEINKEQLGAIGTSTSDTLAGRVRTQLGAEGGTREINIPMPKKVGEEVRVPSVTEAGQAPAEVIRPTAQNAPTAPTSPDESPSKLDFRPLYGNAPDVDPSINRLIDQDISTVNQEAIKGQREVFRNLNTPVQQGYQTAESSKLELKPVTQALTNFRPDTITGVGPGYEWRSNLANAVNYTFGLAGSKDAITERDIAGGQILNKFATLQAQASQKGLGKEAASWLQGLAKAYPSGSLNEEAGKELLSALYVAQQQAVDRAKFYNWYGSKTAEGGKSVEQAFNAFAPQSTYQREKDVIKSIFMNTQNINGLQRNAIDDLLRGRITAQQFDQFVFDKTGGDRNGIRNLSRYFVGG